MSFAEFMRAAAKAETESTVLPEAVIQELRFRLQKHFAPCPFKPGDLVTAEKGGPYRREGEPNIVIEVFDTPYRNWAGDPGSTDFGDVLTMRILGKGGGGYAAFTVNHAYYEPYRGPGSGAGND